MGVVGVAGSKTIEKLFPSLSAVWFFQGFSNAFGDLLFANCLGKSIYLFIV